MDLYKRLNEPLFNGLFDNAFELYYVTLPFTQKYIPDWIFQISLYMPLIQWSCKKIKVSILCNQEAPVSDEFTDEFKDILSDDCKKDE